MASRVKQHQVSRVVLAVSSPNKVAGGPAGLSGEPLGANRAAALLGKPELHQASITARVVYHLKSKTFFKVDFPILVIGIGLSSDLKVSLDKSGFGFAQMNGLPFLVLVRDHSGKYPVASAHCLEVFPPYPGGTPGRVFTLAPAPDHPEDVRINFPKGLLTYYVLVVAGPSADDWIEPLYQAASR